MVRGRKKEIKKNHRKQQSLQSANPVLVGVQSNFFGSGSVDDVEHVQVANSERAKGSQHSFTLSLTRPKKKQLVYLRSPWTFDRSWLGNHSPTLEAMVFVSRTVRKAELCDTLPRFAVELDDSFAK